MYSLYETYDLALADMKRIDTSLGFPDEKGNNTYSQIGKDASGKYFIPVLPIALHLFVGVETVEHIDLPIIEGT